EQPIATAELRLQHVAIGTERLADRRDMHLQCVLFDDGAGPDPIHQVILADQLAVGLHQNGYDLEGPAAERHRHAGEAQFAPCEIDLPPIRGIDRSSALVRHHRDPCSTNCPLPYCSVLNSGSLCAEGLISSWLQGIGGPKG